MASSLPATGGPRAHGLGLADPHPHPIPKPSPSPLTLTLTLTRFQSTHRQDFNELELPPAESLGRKVMMTQNMIDIKGAGDGLWRKEAGITAKNLYIEGTDGGFNQTMTATGIKPKFGFGKASHCSTPSPTPTPSTSPSTSPNAFDRRPAPLTVDPDAKNDLDPTRVDAEQAGRYGGDVGEM